MSDLLARLKIEHWYHALAVLGAAGSLAALAVDLRGIANAHALALFLGIFFVGLGEWINHPIQQTLVPPNLHMRGGGVITGYPRNPKAIGLVFDLLGLVLALTGAYKIAQAL